MVPAVENAVLGVRACFVAGWRETCGFWRRARSVDEIKSLKNRLAFVYLRVLTDTLRFMDSV